jgi:hypothetical protein
VLEDRSRVYEVKGPILKVHLSHVHLKHPRPGYCFLPKTLGHGILQAAVVAKHPTPQRFGRPNGARLASYLQQSPWRPVIRHPVDIDSHRAIITREIHQLNRYVPWANLEYIGILQPMIEKEQFHFLRLVQEDADPLLRILPVGFNIVSDRCPKGVPSMPRRSIGSLAGQWHFSILSFAPSAVRWKGLARQYGFAVFLVFRTGEGKTFFTNHLNRPFSAIVWSNPRSLLQ